MCLTLSFPLTPAWDLKKQNFVTNTDFLLAFLGNLLNDCQMQSFFQALFYGRTPTSKVIPYPGLIRANCGTYGSVLAAATPDHKTSIE